ncbi:MAG: dihydropteroate synthase [Pirellulaceae bacterium]|nr:MAG: dihydropteroate synthase [Pirellulaceae bacterium]
MTTDYRQHHIQFITGKLAAPIVQKTVQQVAQNLGFAFSIDVLPITVAALMSPRWLKRHLVPHPDATMIMVPGHLSSCADELKDITEIPIVVGPREIRELPWFLAKQQPADFQYGEFDIEILAEINHANRLAIDDVVAQAEILRDAGADVIDLGDTPGEPWPDLACQVKELIDRGYRVSIDSFEGDHVRTAVEAGASLVLSVNSTNRQAAVDWGCEVVVIPDRPEDVTSFYESIDFLAARDVPFRADPILEPIGCGFAASLRRYFSTRDRYPRLPMLMGIGNLTELTDVDSAGVNVLLLGICQELAISSVLTTQVINWARTSVRECDIARRLVRFACHHQIPPKHVDPRLVMLRDPRLTQPDAEEIEQLAASIRDRNVRIVVADGNIHALCAGYRFSATDPFEVMRQLLDSPVGPHISAAHAFYLGAEMSKAEMAIQLGKQYRQDEELQWGYLTRAQSHRRL